MEKESFFFYVTVCAATHGIRSVYEILKHKKKLSPGRFSFIIIFTDMMILWMSWIAMCSTDPCHVGLPEVVRTAGLFLSIVGLLFFLTALFTMKTLETYTGDLITGGIYAVIRHPMYLGFILWLTGFPIYFEGGISFLIGFLFIGNVLFWRHLEEIELEHRFPGYKTYKEKTFF